MQTTYEKLFNFALTGQVWLAQHKDNENTKLGYALTRMNTRVQKAQQQYNNLLEDINIECCAVDEKGLILKDERGDYRFDRAGLKNRNQKRQELFESAIEIDPYIATKLPNDLTIAEKEAFKGFVLVETETLDEEPIEELPVELRVQ